MRQPRNGALEAEVLIVENHAPMRTARYDLIRRKYRRLRVVDAQDGASALAHFDAHRPSFVVVDKNPPDANGFDLTRTIKKLSPATLVAVSSMETNVLFAAQALAVGAVAFIGKDKLFDEIVSLVGAAVTLADGAQT